MAGPITWRNVANTVTGNPASALAAATSAFGQVGVGAERNLRRNAEQRVLDEARQRRDLTDQGIRGLFPEVNAPEGADIGAVIKQMQEGQAAEDISASRQATTDVNEQTAIAATRENTPAALARVRQREDDEAQIRKDELELSRLRNQTALKRLGLDTANAAEQTRVTGAIVGAEKLYNSEEPEGLRGQARAKLDEQWPDIVKGYEQSPRIQALAPNERAAEMDKFQATAPERYLGQLMQEIEPQWTAAYQAEHGLTKSQMAETSFGARSQEIQAANTAAIAEEGVKARAEERKLKTRATSVKKNKSYQYVVKSGEGYTLTNDPEAASRNKMKITDLDQVLQDLNIELDEDSKSSGKPAAEQLLRDLNFNKDAFVDALTGDGQQVDRDRWVVSSFFGDDDDIKFGKVKNRAAVIKAQMESAIDKITNPRTAPAEDFASFRNVVSAMATSAADAATPPPTDDELAGITPTDNMPSDEVLRRLGFPAR